MSSFRAAGLSYLRVSTIAARAVRQCLKPEFQAAAARREESIARLRIWQDGKPGEPKLIKQATKA
eukprot:m.31004 g.31004  ORF g.31004 m.31004 type:complete len:65 (-) comp10662_c0_seq2:137-331(-)